MVKEVTAYAKCSILQSFLKRHCRSCATEDPDDGSWVPVRTRTAVQSPALLEKHQCNLIRGFLRWAEWLF